MIDIIFLILLLLAVFKGMRKGFIVAVFSLLAFIIGLAAALKLSAVVALWLQSNTNVNGRWLPFLSFIIVMFCVTLLVRWCAALIEKAIDMAMLGFINKLAGIILYAVLYVIVYSVVLFFITKMNLLKPETIAASMSYGFIEPWGPKIINTFGAIIPLFKDLFIQLENFFSNVAQKASAHR
jgi:membrane protein required for colicin V production